MRFLDTTRVRTRFDERVPVADGTELSVDLYLPPEPGRYPVLLHRTAVDNNRGGRAGISLAPAERWKAFAAQGFIVATGDVRGRGDSDGTFTPFVHEAADGAATLAWLRKHPESNGKIGLLGTGYGAFCAWTAAVADGRCDAIASISAFGGVGEGLVHRGGAVRLDWLFWMHLIGGRTVQPANVPRWKKIHKHRPLRTRDEALGRSDVWWRDWIEHPAVDDPLWKPLDLAQEISRLNISGLHITGWWDGMASGTRHYYEAARRSGAPQQLVVGPWDAAAVRHRALQVGGYDFGPRAAIDLDETVASFFKARLHGEGAERPGQTRSFVTGRNDWVVSAEAPATRLLKLYPSSTIAANTRRGDGVLSAETTGDGGTDSISHNPDMPVEFQPQFASFAAGANPLGFTLDQTHVTARDEALVYTSESLRETTTVFGRPKVVLTVQTAAKDADLYVLLSDSFPAGIRDLHLAHAAIRLATLKTFVPGKPVQVELALDAIAHDFLPGHQIRLTVTPSLYPLYAANPQSGDYAGGREAVVAEIALSHGKEKSVLELPVVGEL